MDHPLVALNNVSHRYRKEWTLRNVDWTLDKGEHWALLGPSGAGKTTLARIVGGYLWPNEGGTIERNGEKQYNLSEWRRNVGWLSTDLLKRIPSSQTVMDTVLAGALGQTRLAQRRDLSLEEQDHERAKQRLEDVNLRHKSEVPFSTLSQGETQLVLIARALVSNPDLLVLDEPCAGMDPGARENFLSILGTTLSHQNDLAVIYITHHVEEILPEFNRVLTLKSGRVKAIGGPEDVLTSDHLSELYGTPFELIERSGRRWPISE